MVDEICSGSTTCAIYIVRCRRTKALWEIWCSWGASLMEVSLLGKGETRPNTHGLHQGKGSCLFPIWMFPTVAPQLVRAKTIPPKKPVKDQKITNPVKRISQNNYIRKKPNTAGPYRKKVLVELAYEWGEPAVSYQWTGWVGKITGWSWRLHGNYRQF